MISQVSQPRLKGFRFPRSIISYAIWAYHRFGLSLRDVEDLLAERGVIVSYESIWAWCQRFGTQIAAKIRRDRPVHADKWHLDEVVISMRGRKHWLRRAVDANGDVLEILMQSRRNAHAAKRFLMKFMKRWGVPRVLVTDKLRSYGVAVRDLCPSVDHRSHKGLNSRSEASHRHTRRREKSWVVSNPRARRSVFYPSMIRPLSSSDQNATAFPQHPTANLGLTRSACGTTMRLKWLLDAARFSVST